jgi:hypothetical protein
MGAQAGLMSCPTCGKHGRVCRVWHSTAGAWEMVELDRGGEEVPVVLFLARVFWL